MKTQNVDCARRQCTPAAGDDFLIQIHYAVWVYNMEMKINEETNDFMCCVYLFVDSC